jgi:hypothetical protein
MVSPQLAELYAELTASGFGFVSRGEHHLQDVHQAVQDRFPDLCDDTVLCEQICRKGTKGPEWQHRVRAALNVLKSKGLITKSLRPKHWIFTSSQHGEHVQQLEQSRIALAQEGYFDPGNIEDDRKKTLREIVQRQGQADFRHKLLVTYGGRCPVCRTPSLLYNPIPQYTLAAVRNRGRMIAPGESGNAHSADSCSESATIGRLRTTPHINCDLLF